ncbi:MAG: tetratricopeptide repeat protein [Myxococcota bacterium]
MRALLALGLVVVVSGAAQIARSDDMTDPLLLEGEEATAQEAGLWDLIEQRRYVRAREESEKYLAEHPDSFIGHLVFSQAQHLGEANFPKALFHELRALELFEAEFGETPTGSEPWRWHARILTALATTHGNLEHYDEQLAFMGRFNELYTPVLKAELAWPLMKLRAFDEARLAAEDGLTTGDPFQIERAKNALCAIEFEAGDDELSYEICRDAVEYARDRFGSATAVDLGNFAESARSVFRFDEAERLLMEATKRGVSWYGNPWLELADLYMRAGRFAESLSALREVPRHRASRPAHVRDSDRNEARRSLAAFLLLMGRPDEALGITDKALVLPDRRSHNSRDPEQDRSIVALLDRLARRMVAEQRIESTTAAPFYVRWWAHLEAAWLRFEGWRSGRQVARFLNDESRLVGTFAIGTARSAVMPPWLVGELVSVLGAGVVRAAVEKARAEDQRPGAAAYYDSVLAEVANSQRDYEDAIDFATRSLEGLQPGDALLSERVRAMMASALADPREQAAIFEEILATDPGLFRRLGWALPVSIEAAESELDDDIASALKRSPRFSRSEDGLRIQVAGGQACLFGRTGTAWGCSASEPPENGDVDPDKGPAQLAVDSFHQVIFSPRVDLSRIDINSLDGSNRVTRNPLDELLQP